MDYAKKMATIKGWTDVLEWCWNNTRIILELCWNDAGIVLE